MERGDISVNVNLGGAEHQIQMPEGAKIILGSQGVMTAKGGVVSLPRDTVVILANGGTLEDRPALDPPAPTR
jgi:hypothetical protein